MKKLFVLTTLLFSTYLNFAQEWVGIEKSAPSKIQENLVSSSENEIIVDVKVGGFFQNAVKTPNGKQMIISGKDMASMLIAGAPDLPMYPIPIIIGDKAEMKVSIVKSEFVDFENVEVAPSKGNLSREINPDDVPYTYGEMYQQDAFYPAMPARLEDPYILRDFRGQNLMVYPYSYNPVTKTLRVYTDLRIAVKKVSDNGINQKIAKRNNGTVSPEVSASYKRRFINYPENKRYSFVEDEGEMLVICIDEYQDAVKPLVEWKNISGRPTTMVPASQTGTLDDMKNYIANYYDSHPNLTYILLVGEYDNLPPYEVIVTLDGLQYIAKTDNYYGMLEGNDFYEEVLVGRLSVKDLEDAKNQVDRIIYYERDIDETDTWLSRGIGISAYEGGGHFGEREYEHIDFIRDTLMNYTYTEISQRYDGVDGYTIAASDITADFNKGAGIVTYCDHGEELKWVLANFDTQCVHNLTNDNMLPFIWTVSCLNGHFDLDECFAESWMRAKNPATGAPVGAIGGMFSWISQPWVPPLYGQDEMVAILTEWRDGYNHTLGGASLNGNMYILDMCPEDHGYTHYSWLLFGDPSMMLRTETPSKMDVHCSSEELLVGMTNYTVNADVDFGIATLSKDGQIVASSYIKNGQANLNFPELTEEGTLKLTVISYNKVTVMKDVEVKSADDAFLIFNDYDLNESDGQLDYGETINIDVTIKNIGAKEANDIDVELVSKSEYVTMTKANATIATLGANETAAIKDMFEFKVADNVPDQEELSFDILCEAGEQSWTTYFSIVANAPKFELDTIYVRNQIIEPGTGATLFVAVRNNGHSEARNLKVEMMSCSADLNFIEPIVTEEFLPAGDVVEIVADFESDEKVQSGTVFEVLCSLKAGNYEFNSNYYITIGQSMEDFETGDFSKTDWQFEGDANWLISGGAYEGSYCAKSGDIDDSQSSSMFVTVDVMEETEISFYYKTACDYYDKLYFYVNDVEIIRWNGNNSPTDWQQFTHVLSKGTYTLKWSYKKDKIDSFSEDCVYIDNIVLPPLNINKMLAPVTNLKAENNFGTITLSWDKSDLADEYIIKRDDTKLSVQKETTFTETLTKEGTYTYIVIAKKNSSESNPATIVVDVTEVSIDEMNINNISIYPNPATDVIYVNINESFETIIYNYQGQMVKKISSSDGKIDISDIKNGIYFVEIKTDNDVIINKIVIE